jgi:hypothetical protein
MSSLRLVAAVGGLALCGISFIAAHAAEGTGGDPSLLRLVQERPFGGPPPPKSRKMDRVPKGTSCKTPSVTCKLQKAQPVGAACSCSGSDGEPIAGKVVEHAS